MIKLSDGNSIPQIGFGTYKSTHETGKQAIIEALKVGYRLIDTAEKYENEATIAAAIHASSIPREQLHLTSKLWRDNLGYKKTKSALENSLRRLKTDYLDSYLIHWPANEKNFPNWKEVNSESWQALIELQQEGKIKSIGLSNFWSKELSALLAQTDTKPAINQIEFHPGFIQGDLLELCQKESIQVQAWSPLARGRIFQVPLLLKLADKYQRSISQICLRWIIQHEVIPIPKSTHKSRIEENIAIFNFQLTTEDMQAIDALPLSGFSGEKPDIWPDRLASN